MNRFAGIVTFVLAAALAGCAGESGVRLAVEGIVLASPDDTVGLAGVTVDIPAAGASTLSGPDGRFVLSGTVPEGIDDRLPIAAVRFRKADLADVIHSVTVVPGARTTIVAVMVRPAVTTTIEIPAGGTTALATADNATFRFRTNSLTDRAGTVLAGSVDVTIAGWDASLPPDPDVAPVRWDALYPPVPTTLAAVGTSPPYLRTLAAGAFAAATGSPSAEPGVGVELISRYADLQFDTLSDADDRLFLVNPLTGLFEEQTTGFLDNGNRIQFDIAAPGTWVWAKALDNPTCVQVVVKVGRRPAPGAHVRLEKIDIQDQPETLYDERIGAEGGTFCLRAPAGKQGRLVAFVGGTTRVASLSRAVVTSGGGDCLAGCPVSTEILMPCVITSDCADGEACSEGQCIATP